jgi:hypothetical protein
MRRLIFAASFVAGITAVPPLAGADGAGATATSSEWVTRSWQSEDGLSQDSVSAIVQTRDGFLWVGTAAGLSRSASPLSSPTAAASGPRTIPDRGATFHFTLMLEQREQA